MKGVKKDVAREKWKPDCGTVTPALLIPTWVFFCLSGSEYILF